MRWPSERLEKSAVLLALTAIIGITTVWKLPYALEGQLNCDAPLYFDMARHLKDGPAAILRINFYQDWNGSTPSVPYHNIGFAMWIRFIWAMRDSLAAISVANALLDAVSLVIYYHLCRLFFSRAASVVSVALLAFSVPYFTLGILPYAEPLQFFLLVGGLYLLWRPGAPRWMVVMSALLLAADFLVRVAHVYSYVAAAATERRRIFFIVSLLAIAGFEGLCLARYGKIYPEYPEPARTFSMACVYPGAYYSETPPHLRFPSNGLRFRLEQTLVITPLHIARFYARGVEHSGWILAVLPVFLLSLRRVRHLKDISPGTLRFGLQAGVALLGYSFTFWWLDSIEYRYLLWVIAFAIPPVVQGLLDLMRPYRRLAFAVMAMFVSVAMVHGYFDYRAESAAPWRLSGVQVPRNQAYAWLQAHSGSDDLVATNELGPAYLIGRPVVSLPRGGMLTAKNVEDYLRIFHPSWVLIDRLVTNPQEPWDPIYNRVLEEAGFRQVYCNYSYWLYVAPRTQAEAFGRPVGATLGQ